MQEMLKLSRTLPGLGLGIVLLAASSTVMSACGRPQATKRPTSTPAQIATSTRQVTADSSTAVTEPQRNTVSALPGIIKRGEFRVGVLFNYPPFSYRADNGDLHGYEVDLISNIVEKWGVKAAFVQVTRQTRIPYLLDGTVDAIAGAVPHLRDAEQLLDYSDTTFVSGTVEMVSNDSGIDSISSIGATTVGVVGPESQADLAAYLTHSGQSASVLPFGSIDDAIAAYKNGTITSIVGRREDLMRATTVLQNEKILGDFISAEPYAFAVREGDTPLRDLLNLTLQDIAKSGKLGDLYGANLYGYSKNFAVLPGDPTINAATFPSQVSVDDSTVERIARGESLRVAGLGLIDTNQPYDGQPIIDGYNRAVLNEFARRWNVRVEEIPQSLDDEGMALLQSGQADMVMSVTPNVSLIGTLGMSQPYYSRALRMIHLQAVTIFGIDDLNYKEIAAIGPIDVSTDLVNKNSEFSKIEPLESVSDAFKQLTAGSVYAVVGDEYSTYLMAKADGRIVVYPKRFRSREYVIGFRAWDSTFAALLNFTLQDMAADGTLDRLINQYFAPYAPPDEPPDRITIERWPGTSTFVGVGGY